MTMNTITLKRIAMSEAGTFGVLVDGGLPFAVTLERRWADNQADVSSIPPGAYRCKRVASPRFGETFEVTGVPGRSRILFHKGNTVADTHGCVLVGEQFEGPAILSSAKGFEEFMEKTRGADGFTLHIEDHTGGAQ
jgi:hypothetical protein